MARSLYPGGRPPGTPRERRPNFADLRSASLWPAVFTRGDDPPEPPANVALTSLISDQLRLGSQDFPERHPRSAPGRRPKFADWPSSRRLTTPAAGWLLASRRGES